MEIYVGSTNPVKHKVFWRGEPTDADSNPTVTIYDITNDPETNINPNTALYSNLATEKAETDIGVYNLNLPVNATYKSRDLRVVWSYVVQGTSQSKEHKLFVVVPYVDLAQASDNLGVGNDPSDPNYKTFNEISSAERYARKVIENYTGQKFYTYSETCSVYGVDSDSLILPSKIESLYKLYSNDILLEDNINNIDNWNYKVDITESGFALRINRANMLDNTVYTANGMVPPTIHDYSGIFKRGVRYTVFGKFGWSEVPDEVELATIELIKDYFSKDNLWRNKYINKISTFDWDFEYGSGSTSGTGNLFADQLLSDYVVSKVILI
jgi:hypothetical protein